MATVQELMNSMQAAPTNDQQAETSLKRQTTLLRSMLQSLELQAAEKETFNEIAAKFAQEFPAYEQKVVKKAAKIIFKGSRQKAREELEAAEQIIDNYQG